MTDKRKCANCNYYVSSPMNENWGKCHKNPPIVPPSSDKSRWPSCHERECCGAWMPLLE